MNINNRMIISWNKFNLIRSNLKDKIIDNVVENKIILSKNINSNKNKEILKKHDA